MGWWIALGILLLLAILPLGVGIQYDESGFHISLAAGPFRIPIAVAKDQDEKPRQPKAQPKGTTGTSGQKQHSQGGNWKDFLPLLSLALDFLGELRRKIRINRLQMELVLAGDDPCDLALSYGKGWALLGDLIPLLENAFVIKKRKIDFRCDFLAEQTKVTASAVITITLGRLLSLALRYGIRAVREYLKINKLRKGGNET